MGDVFVVAPLMFVYAIAPGMIIGLIYDITTNASGLLKLSPYACMALDILFMLVAAVVTFIFLLAANFGIIRFYLIAGEAVGFAVYCCTFMRITAFCIRKSKIFLKKMKKLKKTT